MITAERFALLQVHNQALLQPECPVYVHCSRQCVEQRSGAVFVQVRMVNRSERRVKSVILSAQGEPLRRDELFVSQCAAAPGAIFGEERMLWLGNRVVPALSLAVERVIFEDGMTWRRLPGHRLQTLQEARWQRCTCAMPNPPQAKRCALCGKSLAEELPAPPPHSEAVCSEPLEAAQAAPPHSEQPALPVSAPVFAAVGAPQTPLERPAPIVRMPRPIFDDAQEDYEDEEDDEEEEKRWPAVLLCIVCVLALLLALAFLAYCVSDYMGWEFINI